MIEVYSIIYTAKELRSVPTSERTFFLAMTGLANDVQTLNKQFIMAMDFTDENKIVQQGAHAVAMLNARILAGRMYEGWLNIEKGYPRISNVYDTRFDPKTQEALRELKDYFEPIRASNGPKPPRSLLELIRHKIGFHSDLGMIAKNFNAFADNELMGEYIGSTIVNTLYFSAELVHLQTLSDICGKPENPIAALDRLMTEAIKVTRWLNDFTFGFANAFFKLHFANKLEALPKQLEQIHGQPDFANLKNPFFAEHSRSPESKRAPEAP